MLLTYNSMVALVGAAVMFALVRATIFSSGTEDRPESGAGGVARSAPPADRFGFVQPGVFAQPDADTDDLPLKPGIVDEPETADPWSTETRPETATPPSSRFTLLPSLRLPWRTAKPGTPQRPYTVKSRLAEISPTASVRLAAKFEAAKAAWPPAEITLIAIKDEKVLELYARPSGGAWKQVHRYRVLAASGGAGPKLRQGDRQVPEGVYGIAFLNPNSAYHVSLRVNYPNAFDRQMAAKDGRKDLGGDIMIHGKNLSAGCLAMGDEAVEELFVLAAQTGLRNIKLIIAPTDMREKGIPAVEPGRPEWLPKLYTEVAAAMSELKPPPSASLLSFFTK